MPHLNMQHTDSDVNVAQRELFAKQINDLTDQIDKVAQIDATDKPELQIEVLYAMVAGYEQLAKLFR